MNLHQFAETHDVTNQPPSLDGTNLYRIDVPLQEWSRRFGAGWAESRMDAYGALAGGPLMAAGFLANQGFFDLGEDVVVPAVQVNHGLVTLVDDLACGVGYGEAQGNGGVFVDFHRAFREINE